jgi:hypothetical protein
MPKARANLSVLKIELNLQFSRKSKVAAMIFNQKALQAFRSNEYLIIFETTL